MRNKILTTMLLAAAMMMANAQDRTVLDEHFDFKEGIYLTMDDFLNNRVVPAENITAVHSRLATRSISDYDKNRLDRGLSWEFFAELIHGERSSISVDSLSAELGTTKFEALIPGHNFFGLYINERLYLNISPHNRAGQKHPIFGRAAFIGRLTVLYIDHEFDNETQYYVDGGDGNPVRGGGLQETVRTMVIFDVEENRFEFADERTFADKISDDPELLDRYMADKKRRRHIPYFADLYNQRNPLYVP